MQRRVIDKTRTDPPDAPSRCANCGASLTGAYCAVCGQGVVTDGDFSLGRLAREWAAATFSLDSRGIVTLRRLMLQPGRLSADYIAGRRGATFGPFQIFVFVTVAFFLLPDNIDIFKAPARWAFPSHEALVAEKMAALDMTYNELAIAYDARVGTLSKLGLGLIVGAMAVVGWVLANVGRVRRMRQAGKHLVVAVHDFSFAVLLFPVMIPLFLVLSAFMPEGMMRWMFNLLLVGAILIYLSLSQRRVLRISVWRAALHAFFILAAVTLATMAYRNGVNWLTLRSL